MKILISVVVLFAAAIVGLSLFQGWFGVSASSADGKTSVALTVDQAKIEEDARKAQEKVQELAREAKDKAAAVMEKAPE